MTVKFIRIFLVAVVLLMSATNILFVVENWNLSLDGKAVKASEEKKLSKGEIFLNEPSTLDGECHLNYLKCFATSLSKTLNILTQLQTPIIIWKHRTSSSLSCALLAFQKNLSKLSKTYKALFTRQI